MSSLPPMVFEPILKPKVWGGDRLSSLGKAVSAGDAIGESWEIADLASTSPSGGGGDAARSRVASGPLAGQTLDEVLSRDAPAVLGGDRASVGGRAAAGFPLLIKFLDANTNLSVQVHPSPAYAAAHADAHLKTESWYIVDAAPDAVIYKGVKAGVTRDEFAAAISENRVEEQLIAVPVRAGDCHHLPSGTCHALGAGIVVAEVQTPSDTTFRVYDWGRQGRELHVEQSLACIDFGPPARLEPIRAEAGASRSLLESNEFYELAELRFEAGETEVLQPPGRAVVRMHLSGSGMLDAGDHTLAFSAGVTTLLPAAMTPTSATYTHTTTVLEARVV